MNTDILKRDYGDFFAIMPDEKTAETFIKAIRWPDGPACPRCNQTRRIARIKNGHYRCNPCQRDFTPRKGTGIEGTHLPYWPIIFSLHVVCVQNKKLKAVDLAEIGQIREGSAQNLLRKIRLLPKCENLQNATKAMLFGRACD